MYVKEEGGEGVMIQARDLWEAREEDKGTDRDKNPTKTRCFGKGFIVFVGSAG